MMLVDVEEEESGRRQSKRARKLEPDALDTVQILSASKKGSRILKRLAVGGSGGACKG